MQGLGVPRPGRRPAVRVGDEVPPAAPLDLDGAGMLSRSSRAGMTWGSPVLLMRVRLWTPSVESTAARPALRSKFVARRIFHAATSSGTARRNSRARSSMPVGRSRTSMSRGDTITFSTSTLAMRGFFDRAERVQNLTQAEYGDRDACLGERRVPRHHLGHPPRRSQSVTPASSLRPQGARKGSRAQRLLVLPGPGK